jgi:hypothetical protein
MMDQQQAGMTTIVDSPKAFKAWRMERAAPQPGQAICPRFMYSAVVTFQSMADPHWLCSVFDVQSRGRMIIRAYCPLSSFFQDSAGRLQHEILPNMGLKPVILNPQALLGTLTLTKHKKRSQYRLGTDKKSGFAISS